MLARAYRRAAAGEFSSVLLLADSGIGKTRLAREFLAHRRGRAIALTARAYPLGDTASFGMWSEALESYLRGLGSDEVAVLCDGFLDDLAPLVRSVAAARGSADGSEVPRSRLFAGLAALIANLSKRLPVVVFLDDAHLADASSWEALGYLTRAIPDSRVLVLVVARPAELREQGMATDVVFGLEQEGLLTRLELSPLNSEDLSKLVEAFINESPPRALVYWLDQRCRGNPLFALGLLQALVEEGADLASPELRSLPEELAERVVARLRGLDDDTLSTLEALAVLGRRVELRELLSLTGSAVYDVPVILEQLVRSRLVIEEERGRELAYEIAHPLIAEAIYQRIGGARRRGLHRRVGRALLAAGRLGEAAPHFARSAEIGDAEAIAALSDGVRDAEERAAYRESLTILGALVELIPSGDERWLDVLDALSWRAEWVVDHRADVHAQLGVKALRAIESLLDASSNPIPKASVMRRLANFLGWGTGDLAAAERACAEAQLLFSQGGDRASALLAENELAWIRGLRGDYPGMEVAALQVAVAAEAAGERFAALQAWHAGGFAAFIRGRFNEAETTLTRSNDIARQERKVYRLTAGLNARACAFAANGQLEEAFALVDEAKMLDPAWRDSILPEWETIVHWFAGDFTAALACGREATARAVGELSKRRAIGILFAALSAIEAAQAGRARADLSRARRAFGDGDWQFFSHLCGHVEALLAWQAGACSNASVLLRETAARVHSTGALPFAALILVDLAELASECGDTEAASYAAGQLADIARHIDSDRYLALAAIAEGTRGDTDAARQAAETLSRSNWKALHARALQVLGGCLADSDRAEASAAHERAVVTFDMCGAVWRRDRALEKLRNLGGRGRRAAAAAMGPSGLSPRERQVAVLAAEGQTAREIAEQLSIGERTVETHLANVYSKLRVRSKTDLVRRAAELSLNQ
jgi:DNA-binding CsgD family transcriptional regulator